MTLSRRCWNAKKNEKGGKRAVPRTEAREVRKEEEVTVPMGMVGVAICKPFRAFVVVAARREAFIAWPRGPTAHGLRRLLLWREAIMWGKGRGGRRKGGLGWGDVWLRRPLFYLLLFERVMKKKLPSSSSAAELLPTFFFLFSLSPPFSFARLSLPLLSLSLISPPSPLHQPRET